MDGFLSVRRFISTNIRLHKFNWYVLAVTGAFVFIIVYLALPQRRVSGPEVVGQSFPDDAQRQLALLQTEHELALTDSVYMVLDFKAGQMQLRQRGVVVWNAPLTPVDSNPQSLQDFANKFTAGSTVPVRAVERTHLFGAHPVVSDTILTVVGDALNITPDKLKRYMPERLSICWDKGLCFAIQTDIIGEAPTALGNFEESIRENIDDWLGGSVLSISLTGDQAMALLGVCRPGMITLAID